MTWHVSYEDIAHVYKIECMKAQCGICELDYEGVMYIVVLKDSDMFICDGVCYLEMMAKLM